MAYNDTINLSRSSNDNPFAAVWQWRSVPLIDWSLSVEVFCLILVVVLILNHYDRHWYATPTTRLYHTCLWLSVATITLNILCVFTIGQSQYVPRWVNLLLNSAYFLLVVGLSTVIGYYLLLLILEHVYRRTCLRRAALMQLGLFLLYGWLLLYNAFSGILFSIDEVGRYCRGPLINAGYGVMALQLMLVLLCYLRNRSSISPPMRRVLRILPPTVLLLTAYQLAYPDVLFNGSIIFAADLILLLNFQSRRVEVDALTFIGNRGSFFRELELRLAGKQHFQVLAVSIRQFTYVNQHYGHQQGDALLCAIARWLSGVQSGGTAFRLGNVDFALLLPYTGMVAGEENLNRVYRRFQEPWVLDELHITLECRVAELIHTDQDWTATDALEFLQFSLNLASQRDDRLSPFHRELFLQLERQRHILQLTRRAIRERSFEVWYQPIYHSATRSFSSAEALLRLRDTDGSLVPPDLFIPLAEQTGTLEDLTWAVLEEVCRLLGSGRAPGLQSVSINLSLPLFLSDQLIPRITGCLERHGVPPRQLKIEITERVLAEDMHQVRATIEALTALGIRFYLDDFGVGYSNLSMVLGLPFSCIKLDHSLTQAYPDDRKASAIVEHLMDLFHSIGCQVVAEGVETSHQVRAFTQKGADWLQGYFYARPMPAEALVRFLRQAQM